jgi:outer membrane protein assembly factor BamB
VYVAWNGIHALDAKTGQLIWSNSILTDLSSSPVVANGVLYVAGGSMYALDAATGVVLWQSPTSGGSSYSSPSVANGVIYFSGGNTGLYAFGLPGGNTSH